MIKRILIVIFFFAQSESNVLFAKSNSLLQIQLDTTTLIKDTTYKPQEEDKVIEEVIHSKAPAGKDKAKFLSEVTKYGFKDLFKNYSYNAAMPYSSQVNPYAESYMASYLKSHSKYLKNLQLTAAPYFNLIDGILEQYGLPKELKYLAVIESNLKSSALSVAGARGPWQFMSYTAKEYGLQVNQWADDRTDYYKSTHAAARYLLRLYKDLKDWLLVIAAYNGGPGRVYSAIKKSGSRNFWELQYYLPEESRNHVKKFIATHYIMETGGAEGLDRESFDYTHLSNETHADTAQLTTNEKGNLVELSVSGRYKAAIIADNIEMKLSDFDRYNPQFDNIISTGASVKMQLPKEKMALFEEKKWVILQQCIQQLLNGAVKTSDEKSPAKIPLPKKKKS